MLYLIFNEGYTASSGTDLHRADLAREAIRLTRMVRRQLPDDGELAGLLALMLLTDSRRAARTGPGGDLIPLDEQDRARWDREQIAEGTALVTQALAASALGPYQLQAARSPPYTRRLLARRAPTGPRCTCFTRSWSGSHRTRWSPSTAPSRSPRPRGRRPASRCCPHWTVMSGWRTTTGCIQYARTCWKRPVI